MDSQGNRYYKYKKLFYFIKEIEDWINNYPRAMFDYKSSNMLLLNQKNNLYLGN